MISKRIIDVIFIITFIACLISQSYCSQDLDFGMVSMTASASDPTQQAPPSLIQLDDKQIKNMIISKSSNSTFDDCDNPTNVTMAPNCFYDSVKSMISRLNESVHIYAHLCSLSNKPRIVRLKDLAHIIGNIEGYSLANSKTIPAHMLADIKNLISFKEFKFIGYLKDLQSSFDLNVPRDRIIHNLLLSIGDELDSIVRDQNYPFFLRKNVWHLLQNVRIGNMLTVQYAADTSVCISNTWNYVLHIYEVSRTTNWMKVYNPNDSEVCIKDPTVFSLAPEIFVNGGVVVTFFYKESIVALQGATHTLFTGMINNKLAYEYTLSPGDTNVVHTFKFLDVFKFFNFRK